MQKFVLIMSTIRFWLIDHVDGLKLFFSTINYLVKVCLAHFPNE